MKVFISSTMLGDPMPEMRQAVRDACRTLSLEALGAESLKTSAVTPRGACLDEVGRADGVVLLLGRHYGDAQDGGLSATEQEFNHARASGKDIWSFVVAENPEPSQKEFIERVRRWDDGTITATCLDPAELQVQVGQRLLAWKNAVDGDRVQPSATAELEQLLKGVSADQDRRAFLTLCAAPSSRLELSEDQFFSEVKEQLVGSMILGGGRLLDERPEEQISARWLTLSSRSKSMFGGSRSLSCRFGVDGVSLLQASLEPPMRANPLEVYFLPPSRVIEKMTRLFGVMRAFYEGVDPDRLTRSIALQAVLTNGDRHHFKEIPPKIDSVSVPGMLGEREPRHLYSSDSPEPITRGVLAQPRDLVSKVVGRWSRELDAGGDNRAF